MDRIIELFEEIKETSSIKSKIDLIYRNRGNNGFVENLVFLLDNRIVTGISTKSLNKDVGTIKAVEIADEARAWNALKDWLIEHQNGSKREIIACQKFLKSVPERHRSFYEQMITKKYRLGCDYKSVNKAIPGLIWTYETQQAYPINDNNKPRAGEWFSLSEKLNGINGGFIEGKCLSRQGKEITGMQHIIKDIKALGLEDYYVNGELIRDNIDNIPDSDNFQLTTSIVNSDAKKKDEIVLVFYEAITKQEFYNGFSELPYKKRLFRYKVINENIKKLGLKHIRFVKHYYSGIDPLMIKKWLDYANTHNKEGIMLNKDTQWLNHRNAGILKIKSFKTCDVRCISVEKGDGKYIDTLGRITCDYKGTPLGIGSGFTDAQRKYYWKHKERIVGKIVTVKYKTETTNNNGTVSVQFPVFVGVRNDKDEENYES